MGIQFVIILFLILMSAAIVSEPIARALRLPHASILVVLGFAGSEIAVMLGYDTGIRASNFSDLVFYVFIPVLVFEAAYNINTELLLKNISAILFLSVAGMLMTTLVAAAGLYYGIGHDAGFPWVAALLTGALLAATDPVAVVAQLRQLGAPKRLAVLLEGESLFNDASAIVLFSLFLSLAVTQTSSTQLLGSLLEFLMVFLGGACVGAVVGVIAGMARKHSMPVPAGVVSLVTAYGSFFIAETLHVSGVMSVLLAGLIASLHHFQSHGEHTGEKIGYLWDVTAYIANSMVFLIMGVTITMAMFEERWLAMLIAIFAILVARSISIYGALPVVSLFMRETISMKYQTVMVWGGLRGAVTLALALSLPTELDYWWTIQSIAFGVVIFTLFVQAPTTGSLLRVLGMSRE